MTDITLTLNPAQVQAIQFMAQFMKSHCEQILSGIASIPLNTPAAEPAPPSEPQEAPHGD